MLRTVILQMLLTKVRTGQTHPVIRDEGSLQEASGTRSLFTKFTISTAVEDLPRHCLATLQWCQ
jgi:hypothetical protein